MVKLLVDNREEKIIQIIQNLDSLNFNFIIKQLNIGDFQILLDNDDIIHVYERKTLKDLECSIKDGRYKEQKNRLLELKNNGIKVFYIIENFTSISDIKDKSVLGSIISISLSDDIPCLFTNNYSDTFLLLKEIMLRVQKDTKKFYEKKELSESINITKKRSDNINKENILIIMLSQIPGISEKVSTIIYNHHNTISSLISKLNQFDSDKQKIVYLSSLKIDSIKRSVGEKTAEKIISFLY